MNSGGYRENNLLADNGINCPRVFILYANAFFHGYDIVVWYRYTENIITVENEMEIEK